MAFFILSLLSARDLDIGPEGRYQSRADDKGNMKKAMYSFSFRWTNNGIVPYFGGKKTIGGLMVNAPVTLRKRQRRMQ
jgi:hypothetical protein